MTRISRGSRALGMMRAASARTPVCRDIGLIEELAAAFPGRRLPPLDLCAFAGEAVASCYDDRRNFNLLYCINLQTCVNATIYSRAKQKGVSVHVDHNLEQPIAEVIRRALLYVADRDVQVVLAGGAREWLASDVDIGPAVEYRFGREGIPCAWLSETSFSGMPSRTGVVLDLADGSLTHFRHRGELAESHEASFRAQVTQQYFSSAPAPGSSWLSQAQPMPAAPLVPNDNAPLVERAASFEARLLRDPVRERDGVAYRADPSSVSRIMSNEEIAGQRFAFHEVRAPG